MQHDTKYEFEVLPDNFKPVDFGANGITGSLDKNGKLIALNSYHPQHGYVSLSATSLDQDGFGFLFDKPIVKRGMQLVKGVIPFFWVVFDDGSEANVTTIVHESVVIRRWQFEGMLPQRWGGHIALSSMNTPLPIVSKLHFADGILTLENPALGCAAAIAGLPQREPFEMQQAGAIEVLKEGTWRTQDFMIEDNEIRVLYIFYAFGATAEEARHKVQDLDSKWANEALRFVHDDWDELMKTSSTSRLVRRGLTYSLSMAVPVQETITFLSDHMQQPITSNHDAYYTARALLSWRPEMTDLIRRHLLWMFKIADRSAGFWARQYHPNGQVLDAQYELQQQLYPWVEVVDYLSVTGDQAILKEISPIASLLDQLDPHGLIPEEEHYSLTNSILLWRILSKLAEFDLIDQGFPERAHQTIFDRFHYSRQGLAALVSLDRKKDAFQGYGLPILLAPYWNFIPAANPAWMATALLAIDESRGCTHDLRELLFARAINDQAQEAQCRQQLEAAAYWDGALPEENRQWCAYPNALLACLELNAFNS